MHGLAYISDDIEPAVLPKIPFIVSKSASQAEHELEGCCSIDDHLATPPNAQLHARKFGTTRRNLVLTGDVAAAADDKMED